MTELPKRKRPEGCVTNLAFDAWFAGELDDARKSALEAHLASCERCAARRDTLANERESFLSDAPVLRRPTQAPATRTARRLRWVAPVTTTLAIAATLMLVLLREPQQALDGTRAKGSERIGFFVKHGEQVRRGQSGERVVPGDALRFTYSAASERYLAILSLDGAQHASVYFPNGPKAERVRAGSDEPLATSVELDDTLGEEHVIALFCAEPVELEPLRVGLERERAAFRAPAHCSRAELRLIKEAKSP